MKGVPIKFRGKDVQSGEYVYFRLEDYIDEVGGYYRVGEDENCHYVKIDELEQLVGYDDDGKEIYEGDLVDYYGTKYTAKVITLGKYNKCKLAI